MVKREFFINFYDFCLGLKHGCLPRKAGTSLRMENVHSSLLCMGTRANKNNKQHQHQTAVPASLYWHFSLGKFTLPPIPPQEPARSFSCESQELLSFTPAKFFGISAPPRETIRQEKRSQCPSPLSLATSFVSPKYWLLYFLSNKMEENSLRERNKRKNLKPQQVHNLGYDLIVTL